MARSMLLVMSSAGGGLLCRPEPFLGFGEGAFCRIDPGLDRGAGAEQGHDLGAGARDNQVRGCVADDGDGHYSNRSKRF